MFSLASMATMAACIFLFGLFFAIVTNFQSMVKAAEEGVAVTVLFDEDITPQEIAEMMIAEIPPEQTMWVISNEKGINGAASMLYENELHELAESLESDLYILPSSVHEVIAVSSDMGSPEMLAQMVVEVNMQEVSLDERLSNQVYHYDKDLRKLTLATDTPNKRLDGIVAEPPLVYDAKEKSR